MKSIFTNEHQETIKLIKTTRIQKGVSQKQLAYKLGCTQSYVSKIENGQIRLDIYQLKKIAKILDFDIGILVK